MAQSLYPVPTDNGEQKTGELGKCPLDIVLSHQQKEGLSGLYKGSTCLLLRAGGRSNACGRTSQGLEDTRQRQEKPHCEVQPVREITTGSGGDKLRGRETQSQGRNQTGTKDHTRVGGTTSQG